MFKLCCMLLSEMPQPARWIAHLRFLARPVLPVRKGGGEGKPLTACSGFKSVLIGCDSSVWVLYREAVVFHSPGSRFAHPGVMKLKLVLYPERVVQGSGNPVVQPLRGRQPTLAREPRVRRSGDPGLWNTTASR